MSTPHVYNKLNIVTALILSLFREGHLCRRISHIETHRAGSEISSKLYFIAHVVGILVFTHFIGRFAVLISLVRKQSK